MSKPSAPPIRSVPVPPLPDRTRPHPPPPLIVHPHPIDYPTVDPKTGRQGK